MIKIILISIISFMVGYGASNITRRYKTKRENKKVKPLSKMTKQEFKKAMKDLEIR